MGDCASTEASRRSPVRLVNGIPRGSLTVFGDKYVVKSPKKEQTQPASANNDKENGADKTNTKKRKDPRKKKPPNQKQKTLPVTKSLVMKLRPHLLSWSGDSFTVVDVSNDDETLFKVGGEAYSIDQRRTVVDAKTEEEVFVIRENFLQIDDYQTIYRPGKGGREEDEEVFRVCSGLGNYHQWTEGLKNNKGKSVKLSGRMNLFLKGHIFVDRGQDGDSRKAIAKVMSPLDWCDFWPIGWERDSYLVEVAPGVDYALILAMALAFEKMLQTYDSSSDW